ncbi:MAG TPA: D-aminoacyl-tRNA deacylase [Bacteroidia bacterium]|nr:D-tyrosyl-tRNA(Tyr) deacylase [Sphingobacteriales bacterium]HPD64330.1 D-aminoacyl-tRNA deacylase [Bacteroidia bacterium]HRU68062.1 D-aminoacyl-tRNA deacylase [Bacteroidia bacterium]
MRVVIQRVKEASVHIDHQPYSSIGKGLLVFLGIEHEDEEEDVSWLCKKISQLRIFDDAEGIMNLSVSDTDGEIMVVSQFTLHASTKKGNRPSYIRAARPEKAIPLYENFIKTLKELINKEVKSGVFGAMMDIHLINDGPVTILIDSRQKE